jgi:hypothetical protein
MLLSFCQLSTTIRAVVWMPRNKHSKLKWLVAEKRHASRSYNPAITCFHAGLNFHAHEGREMQCLTDTLRIFMWVPFLIFGLSPLYSHKSSKAKGALP